MSARLPIGLWALLGGNFVIGTGVMVVAGTLNELSASLRIDAGAAGQLISAGAIVMCLGAPLLAAWVAGWDRRLLLTGAMLWYAVGHALTTLVTGYGAVLVVRMLTVIAPAIFTAQAAACAGWLVPTEERGRAVTFVFLGWSVASVLGLPIGTLLGGQFGWRVAFWAVALMSLASAWFIWKCLPAGIRPPSLARADWRRVLGSPILMGVVGVTALQGAGQFLLSSYFAPLLKRDFDASPIEIGALWCWFGLWGLVGNLLASRSIDRLGPARLVLVTTGLMAMSLLLWPLAGSLTLLFAIVVPWGLGCFAANSAQQARLVALATTLAPASLALNSSGIYIGQALGASAGGWMLLHEASGWMSWAAVMLLLCAFGLSLALDRRLHRPDAIAADQG